MNIFKSLPLLILTLFILFFQSCENGQTSQNSPPKQAINSTGPLFELLTPAKTGVVFKNIIKENLQNNLMTNNLIYSGAGTAIGDLNNDGLQDLVFISNTEKPAIYINKGDFRFEALGLDAGFKKVPGWLTGVTIADVNADGYEDIYICRSGLTERDQANRKNLLYINQGNLKFKESAAKYGLDDSSVSTQASFFDYDLDGDLDVYVLNYLPGSQKVAYGELKSRRTNPSPELIPLFSDHLYRNDGNKFTDVTSSAGISNWGHGLGIATGDVNKDGYPDIYIANDFEMDDFYYENNGNGTFTEKLSEHFGHVSFFAMGVDMADVNNDTYLDVFEVEMLPKDRKRAVLNMQPMDRGRFEDLLKIDLAPQYMRNSLHINRGNGHFSDVAQIAGVAKTDWSWGALLIDMNDDGHKDIYVTNGILRDSKDRDFQLTGNKKSSQTDGRMTLEEMNNLVPSTKIKNYAYQNNKDLTFADKTMDWGFDFKGFSNAVSYGDLDNDGDLDLIVNNLNDFPLIYQNTSSERGMNNLNIKLKGPKANENGIGTKVKISTDNGLQYQELYTVRGFQACSEPIIHFGLGKLTMVNEVEVTWPDGKVEILENVKANSRLNLKYKNAKTKAISSVDSPKLFAEMSSQLGVNFSHRETYFDDYKREILIPHKMSQNGPFISTADVNGDKLDDFYIGGARGQEGKLYIQNKNGTFAELSNPAFVSDKIYEDMSSEFFDADNDGDLDLYVVSGSNEFEKDISKYQDRLYVNNGTGTYKKSNALPRITSSGSVVSSADFDEDGDMDLFVGGRVVPQKYPQNPTSYLLINEKGKFIDKTDERASGLKKLGMITSSVWTDYDKDDDLDLIVTGEWMPISIWENKGGKLAQMKSSELENTGGWWSSIEAKDLDNDGDEDYILGNIGLNHKFKANEEKPFHVYCDDFDNTGSLDIVLAFHQEDKLFPVRGRDCSSEQMPFITEKFPSFAEFGDAQVKDIFGEKLNTALHKEVKTFASTVMINNGGKFEFKQLPIEAQLSAINGTIAEDFTGNGHQDLLIAGNMFETEAETSRADASIGLLLEGNGDGTFTSVSVDNSGFFTPGDVKDLKMLKKNDGSFLILVANNNSSMEIFQFDRRLQ